MAKKQAKQAKAHIKLRIPAGKASAGPPVGSTLGQYGVNMMDFVQPFNDQTKDMGNATVTAHITIFDDRSMEWRVVGEATDDMIKRIAGIQKGSGKPQEDKVAKLTKAQVEEIAKAKMHDMNTQKLDSAVKQVAGTARSMGVEVEE